MAIFRVYRDGFNAANNSAIGSRPEDKTQLVATVEADCADSAIAAALAGGATCYNGQTIYARTDAACAAEERAAQAEHAGQVLVRYWIGTTAVADWCATVAELDECLSRHANSYPPTFADAAGNDLDYDGACAAVATTTISRVTYRWDEPGWYCESWHGQTRIDDSQKVWFPVAVDNYGSGQAADLAAALAEAFPGAEIVAQ